MTDRLLVVDAPHFYAAAVWRLDADGQWQCVEAAPILRWMVGQPASFVAGYLNGKGWAYSWHWPGGTPRG